MKILLSLMGFAILFLFVPNREPKFTMIKIPNKNFEMSQTEVTQNLYKYVMKENPSKHKKSNNPVEKVSWYDAIYFCNILSVLKGYEPVYEVYGNTFGWGYTPHQGEYISDHITQNTSANGYRLPTLEEWQYAAKCEEDFTYAGSNELDEVAWYCENSNDKTHPVAQKKANAFGLYDMSGNVWEWCWDSEFFNLRYLCGGSFCSPSDECVLTVDDEDFFDCYYRFSNIGFRIVRSVSE